MFWNILSGCCSRRRLNDRVFSIPARALGLEEVVLGHLREIGPDCPFRPRVVDLVRIVVVNLAWAERAVLTNDVVDDPLVRRE
jgi:hypothetical protein